MLRKTRRLLIKVAFAGTFFWIACLIILRIQSSIILERHEISHSLTKRPGLDHGNTASISLNSRDAELQRRFIEGHKLLNEAQSLGFTVKNNDKKLENVIDYGSLDNETRALIAKGLIHPRWELFTPEEPEYPNAPGELGIAYIVNASSLMPDEKIKFDKLWNENAFNGYASDKISLHRSLVDPRDRLCKKEDYSDIKINTSVIIIFHNEDWNVLLRTVHSVFDRSPPKLIEEIILVDDFSDRDHLGIQLDRYMSQFSRVKILRADKRQGLIRARLMGAAKAKGDVLTFLDSHCECTKGWLQPLLKRIQEDETHVVTPVIDVIDEGNFKYLFGPASITNLGGFDWNLQFTWHAIPHDMAAKRKSEIEPLRSPTMAGGLFSISRKYFERIGAYDPGMEVWGGENLELSFRIWMCGGSLEIIQCSHVGHVFRKRSPYRWTVADAVRRNSIRTALVWMDDYSKYYLQKISHHLGNYGDISERVALRKSLQCKSFQWYLDNIYPQQFVPDRSFAIGEIKSKLVDPKKGEPTCLEVTFTKASDETLVKASTCFGGRTSQMWYLTKRNEIYVENSEGACLDYAGNGVKIFPCHGLKGNQEWQYRPDQTIYHVITRLCLTIYKNLKTLAMEKCTGADNQVWHWRRNTPKISQE